MWDDLDTAFTTLRTDAPQPVFATAEAVRRRGRRRTHRQVAVAGIAVVGVLAGAGTAVSGPPPGGSAERAASTPSPTGAPLRTPDPTVTTFEFDPELERAVIPDATLLQVSDLPVQYTARYSQQPVREDWPVGLLCRRHEPDAYPSRFHVHFRRTVGFVGKGPAGDDRPPVTQTVIRYDEGWAARSFADLDAVRTTCGEEVTSFEYPELARGFAGDESRLLRNDPISPKSVGLPGYLVVVRVGERVTTIEVPTPLGEAVARELGVRAAARLAGR